MVPRLPKKEKKVEEKAKNTVQLACGNDRVTLIYNVIDRKDWTDPLYNFPETLYSFPVSLSWNDIFKRIGVYLFESAHLVDIALHLNSIGEAVFIECLNIKVSAEEKKLLKRTKNVKIDEDSLSSVVIQFLGLGYLNIHYRPTGDVCFILNDTGIDALGKLAVPRETTTDELMLPE